MLLCALPAGAAVAHAAVATNFRAAFASLAEAYRQSSSHEIRMTAGATGKLYAQIVQGAPFDLFFAADSERPARLAADQRAGQPFTYAVGRLILVGADDPALLAGSAIRRVAIANARLAPYGRAARQAIDALALSAALSDKLVIGENVGQAMAMVATGNAQAGFVAASLLPGSPLAQLPSWAVPAGMHDPIRQDAVLLNRGKDNDAALGFIDFLSTEAARQVLLRFGYPS